MSAPTARQLLNSWMATFPGPTCIEQQEVVDATEAWLLDDDTELTPLQMKTVKRALVFFARNSMMPSDIGAANKLLRELP
jgi:hypothetical protein